MKIILKDGRIIQTRQEEIIRMVKESLIKEGLLQEEERSELKRFNKPQEASEDYVIEELQVELAGYSQGKKLTKEGVKALFDAIRRHAAANKYYVGITCDPSRREGEHNADFLAVVTCPNKDKANEMEKALDDKGFDAGSSVGNVHKSKSKKVYIYKKTSKTVE